MKEGHVIGGVDNVLVTAASRGIIQREHQRGALFYKNYSLGNPFDRVTKDDLDTYRREVERKEKRRAGRFHTNNVDANVSSPLSCGCSIGLVIERSRVQLPPHSVVNCSSVLCRWEGNQRLCVTDFVIYGTYGLKDLWEKDKRAICSKRVIGPRDISVLLLMCFTLVG